MSCSSGRAKLTSCKRLPPNRQINYHPDRPATNVPVTAGRDQSRHELWARHHRTALNNSKFPTPETLPKQDVP